MTWSVVTTRTGPDDAYSVVWAICESFFEFLRIFYILTNNLLYIKVAIYEICDVECGYNENRPKRRQTRHLGHR